jgi:hypothetical protein
MQQHPEFLDKLGGVDVAFFARHLIFDLFYYTVVI